MGDAYMNLGDTDNAIKYWIKAGNNSNNEFTSPIYLKRAGMACEEEGDFSKAVDLYQKIKAEYPNTNEGREIEKFITRAELKQ